MSRKLINLRIEAPLLKWLEDYAQREDLTLSEAIRFILRCRAEGMKPMKSRKKPVRNRKGA